MRPTLAKWVSDADALHQVQRFGIQQTPLLLSYVRERSEDYYLSLVGELFQRIRHPYENQVEWSRLANALLQAGVGWDSGMEVSAPGILESETALFAAAAFYFGGYPASSYLILRGVDRAGVSETQQACYELLSRPTTIQSDNVRALVGAVRRGNLHIIRDQVARATEYRTQALNIGPDEWIGSSLLCKLLERFETTNLRSVLPNGEDEFWSPLVRSLINRTPPCWDFFPSQIEAIRSGLLESASTYSLQMPTSAGKTALCETLLYYHLKTRPNDVAVMLVPYRSLASELRGSLVKRLNRMGLYTRCVYGGTVPTGDEIRGLDETRAIVATPESLSGLLSADPTFFARVSLVICDEGHLLDGQARGVGLELLLSRMKAREIGAPRFIFVSAIVPNIEEINSWLGGTEETVVRSEYRPALAEFASLRVRGTGATRNVVLELHPHEAEANRFAVEGFLSRDDFRYRNPLTGSLKTYSFSSVKTQAIAAARKTLTMGAVAVFAANKRGNQGAVGLAEELLSQLKLPLSLPMPLQFVQNAAFLQEAVEYFGLEYGYQWVGTQALASGAVLHHGDIPQESREVVETLVRDDIVRMAICTSTLAEGVNLPIRTLVLYSVQRRGPDGAAKNLLARDIKNLVGRAGRAGATTKGLVICANPNQWTIVEPVANQAPGEPVVGALHDLMGRLWLALRQRGLALTNEILERNTPLHTLIDGIDATLIDLAVEEMGEDEFVQIARELAGQTFAASRAEPDALALMRNVFELRARRVAGIRNQGRLAWIRETGTKARMLDSVETSLLPLRENWDDITAPTDPDLISAILTWAWSQPDVLDAISEAFGDNQPTHEAFGDILTRWLDGQTLLEISNAAGLELDVMLGVHAKLFNYVLQVSIEQAVGLLRKLLEANERVLAQAVIDLPEHIRFGVPTSAARILAAGGVRHRRAAVALGRSPELTAITAEDWAQVFPIARRLMEDEVPWRQRLGSLVLKHTIEDLSVTVIEDEH